MIVDPAKNLFGALGIAGRTRAGGGCGNARCSQNACGDDGNLPGIYQRRMVGAGVTLASRKKAGRWAIGRNNFYPFVITHTLPQEAWRDVFAAGKAQYDLLTDAERLRYLREARTLCMSGYNLFMSRWLQSHRA